MSGDPGAARSGGYRARYIISNSRSDTTYPKAAQGYEFRSEISAERPFLQAREVEAVNVLDQRDKSARSKIERGLAFVERTSGGVSRRTARMKVLRHPAETGWMARAQLREFALHRHRRRLCVRHLRAHRLGLQREHERGLDLPRMDAVQKLFFREQPLGIAKPVPRGGDHEHAEADAQIARNDIDDRRIAAV